jgi:PAS domain S-box-containing protein
MSAINTNFEFDSACCVYEAFKKLSTKHYDIVISDYEMPQKNGLEFLKELREQKNDIPFIIFTGRGREDVAVNALNLGADRYLNKNGSPEAVYVELTHAIEDIVDRNKSRQLLRLSESKYRMLVEKSLQGILIAQNAPLHIAFANTALGNMLGYKSEEFTSFSPAEVVTLVHSEDKHIFFGHIKDRFEGKKAERNFQFRAIRKDGSIVWMEAFVSEIEYNRQRAVQAMFLDIDERKKSHDILRMKEQELENILDSSPTIVFYKDLTGKFIQANKTFAKALNTSKDNLLGKTVFDIYSAKIAQNMTDDDNVVLKSKTPKLNIVEPYESPTGLRWLRTHKIPTFDEKGEVTGLIGFSEEITDYRKAEAELKESLNNYHSLINGMSDAVWVVDFSGNFVDVNDASVKILGYSKDELLSFGIKDVDKYLTPEQANAIMSRVVSVGTQSFETVHTAKDGMEIPVEISSSLITFNGKQAVLGVARNITERKRAEQVLLESEEKYRTLFEQAGDYTLILEAQSTGVPIILDANTAALQIHGYTREEIIGKPITFLDEESGIDSVLSRSIKLLNNEKLTFETKHRRKDGSTIDVEVSIKRVKVGSKNLLVSVERDITERKKNEDALRQERGMLESVTKNIGAGLVMISKDYKILWMNNFLRQFTDASENNPCYSSFNTCTTICPDCGPKKIFEGADFDSREYCNQTEFNKDHPVWFELIATPIKDKDGNVVAALELTVNITEKKEAEKKLKESSDKIDLMNEKLRVVGGLTRHDVRNKLSAVTGYAYLLKKKHGDLADVVEGIGKMEMAVRESMKIFDFAKMYEQLGAEELVQIDVEAKINEATTLFSGPLPKIINDCNGLTVLADSFLRQLFYNFIDNTRKYGQITTIIKVHYKKTDQGNLVLIYEDDGVGISAENKLKLFSEGFSTGGSTGFGLFLTKKMIDVYGWKIEENGEPGKGAKFVMTIPKLNKNGKENYQIVP